MNRATGAGTAMHLDSSFVRFASGARRGSKGKFGTEHIPELRKLLRADKTIAEIAAHFGTAPPTLMNFIKRRRLCNLTERRNFITLKRSLAKEARP